MNGDSPDPDFSCGSVGLLMDWQFLQIVQCFPSINHPVLGKNHLKHYCERKKKHSSCPNCSMQLPTHCPALQYGKAYKLQKGMAIATTQIQCLKL